MTRVPTLLACIVLADIVTGQAPESDSPILAIAHGMSVDGATPVPGAGPGTLLFAASDLATTPPDAWVPSPGLPDFSSVLSGLPLDVDAVSVGLDYVQSTALGVGVVPPGNWAGITFSVTRSTVGVTGEVITREATLPGGAAADVFFYVLPGSALPAALVDRTMRNQDSAEISVDVPGAIADIDAHDVYLSLVYRENPSLVPLLPFRSVFFSVDAASVPLVPAGWWGGAPASGATILRRDWSGSAWSAPYPAFTPSDLGLTAAEDVDALAVDVIRGRVLFSTTRPATTPGVPARDPVLFHRIGTPGHHVYRTVNGAPVSSRIGLDLSGGIDDVDGICALDPGPTGQPRFDRVIGTAEPLPVPLPVPNRLAAAAFRRQSLTGPQDEIVSYMTGWPGPGQPGSGFAAMIVGVGTPSGPFVTHALRSRPSPSSPYAGFAGHPEQAVLQVPTAPSLFGLDVHLVWVAWEAALFDVANPVMIRL